MPRGSLWVPLVPVEPVVRKPLRVCGSPPSWPGEPRKPLSSPRVFVCSQQPVCLGVHVSSPGQGPATSPTLLFPLRSGGLSAHLPGLPGAPDPALQLRTQDEPRVRTVWSRWAQRPETPQTSATGEAALAGSASQPRGAQSPRTLSVGREPPFSLVLRLPGNSHTLA